MRCDWSPWADESFIGRLVALIYILSLFASGFGIMTSLLMNVPTSKLVLALEGGYALVPTRNGVEASMRVLLVQQPFLCFWFTSKGENPPALPTISPSLQGYVDILMAVDQLSEFWPVLNDLSEVPNTFHQIISLTYFSIPSTPKLNGLREINFPLTALLMFQCTFLRMANLLPPTST